MVNPLKSQIISGNAKTVDAKTGKKRSSKKGGVLRRIKKAGGRVTRAVSEQASKLGIVTKAKHERNLVSMVNSLDPQFLKDTEDDKADIQKDFEKNIHLQDLKNKPKLKRSNAFREADVVGRRIKRSGGR
jgi:hypothetical protein